MLILLRLLPHLLPHIHVLYIFLRKLKGKCSSSLTPPSHPFPLHFLKEIERKMLVLLLLLSHQHFLYIFLKKLKGKCPFSLTSSP